MKKILSILLLLTFCTAHGTWAGEAVIIGSDGQARYEDESNDKSTNVILQQTQRKRTETIDYHNNTQNYTDKNQYISSMATTKIELKDCDEAYKNHYYTLFRKNKKWGLGYSYRWKNDIELTKTFLDAEYDYIDYFNSSVNALHDYEKFNEGLKNIYNSVDYFKCVKNGKYALFRIIRDKGYNGDDASSFITDFIYDDIEFKIVYTNTHIFGKYCTPTIRGKINGTWVTLKKQIHYIDDAPHRPGLLEWHI